MRRAQIPSFETIYWTFIGALPSWKCSIKAPCYCNNFILCLDRDLPSINMVIDGPLEVLNYVGILRRACEKFLQTLCSILQVRILQDFNKGIHVIIGTLLIIFTRTINQCVSKFSRTSLEQQFQIGTKWNGNTNSTI